MWVACAERLLDLYVNIHFCGVCCYFLRLAGRLLTLLWAGRGREGAGEPSRADPFENRRVRDDGTGEGCGVAATAHVALNASFLFRPFPVSCFEKRQRGRYLFERIGGPERGGPRARLSRKQPLRRLVSCGIPLDGGSSGRAEGGG